ncbi:hypothetical protein ACFQZS_06480 [Mucilaginibacter calamicampi]|uniref:Outer membrane protein beta-barrel domain-containing protein n=1 Tax=Mucilaginibacter calamicampi TaxID=1302352 RepID=A0ABW2YZ05_9SPHI
MKNEQDLFNEIGNVLHTHEDAYVPGAWEEFVKKKKRTRGLVYIRLLAAAAVLLFLGYAAWLFVPVKQDGAEDQQTKNTAKPPYIHPKNSPGHDSLLAEQPVVPQKGDNGAATAALPLTTTQQPAPIEQILREKAVVKALPQVSKPDEFKNPSVSGNVAEVVKVKTDPAIIAGTVTPSKSSLDADVAITYAPVTNAPPTVNTEPKRYERGTQRLNYDSLANLNKPKPIDVDEKKHKNLSYAVLLSPSVGNQKMNFGTGVEVAYNINKNLSVSSGLSYTYVNASSTRGGGGLMDASPNYSLQGYNTSYSTKPAAASSTSAQTLQGAKLALSGLEIPLSFQYKTKNGFYVSAGVSAMSVIANDLSYNYLNNRAVSTVSANGLANTISVVTEEITEKSSEKLSGYVGFYTLSAGKKINFGRGKLNFAPFIKVPFSRVSSQNIQLIHGGVQLGFGF